MAFRTDTEKNRRGITVEEHLGDDFSGSGLRRDVTETIGRYIPSPHHLLAGGGGIQVEKACHTGLAISPVRPGGQCQIMLLRATDFGVRTKPNQRGRTSRTQAQDTPIGRVFQARYEARRHRHLGTDVEAPGFLLQRRTICHRGTHAAGWLVTSQGPSGCCLEGGQLFPRVRYFVR